MSSQSRSYLIDLHSDSAQQASILMNKPRRREPSSYQSSVDAVRPLNRSRPLFSRIKKVPSSNDYSKISVPYSTTEINSNIICSRIPNAPGWESSGKADNNGSHFGRAPPPARPKVAATILNSGQIVQEITSQPTCKKRHIVIPHERIPIVPANVRRYALEDVNDSSTSSSQFSLTLQATRSDLKGQRSQRIGDDLESCFDSNIPNDIDHTTQNTTDQAPHNPFRRQMPTQSQKNIAVTSNPPNGIPHAEGVQLPEVPLKSASRPPKRGPNRERQKSGLQEKYCSGEPKPPKHDSKQDALRHPYSLRPATAPSKPSGRASRELREFLLQKSVNEAYCEAQFGLGQHRRDTSVNSPSHLSKRQRLSSTGLRLRQPLIFAARQYDNGGILDSTRQETHSDIAQADSRPKYDCGTIGLYTDHEDQLWTEVEEILHSMSPVLPGDPNYTPKLCSTDEPIADPSAFVNEDYVPLRSQAKLAGDPDRPLPPGLQYQSSRGISVRALDLHPDVALVIKELRDGASLEGFVLEDLRGRLHPSP